MWHRRKRRRLGVKTKHRKALIRNLVRGLAFHRRIITTVARAKETSRFADHMITLAKEGTLAARRQLIRRLGSSEVAKVFMEEIAPRFQDRQGGYTRVLKTAFRPGDGALKALVEFSVPVEIATKKKEKKVKKEKPAKPVTEERPEEKKPEKKPAKKEPKEPKVEKEKAEPGAEKEETEKRGGFLSKLRKFLKGD